MQKANVGDRFDDGLSVQFQDHAQYAVCRRMLRTHVENHSPSVAGWRLETSLFRVFGADRVGVKYGLLHAILFVLVTVLVAVHRIIFWQWVTFPTVLPTNAAHLLLCTSP